jgi:hypothetical protein
MPSVAPRFGDSGNYGPNANRNGQQQQGPHHLPHLHQLNEGNSSRRDMEDEILWERHRTTIAAEEGDLLL